MAIVKNSYRVSRLDGDNSHIPASSDVENESSFSLSAGDAVSDSGASDADSGMASDELEISELREPGTELCQVGNQSFVFPLELYDLPNLDSVLSLETWNDCLSEEERFQLAEYLPDLDQEDFAVTLKELFSGSNFHFGSPMAVFFNQLKAGLCDPMVVLHRRGLNIFRQRQHYHHLCEYQNSMVETLVKIKDWWTSCDVYGIEDRLRLLNILRSQKSLGHGKKNGDIDSDSHSGSSGWDNNVLNGRLCNDRGGSLHSSKKASHVKGILKVATSKLSAKNELGRGSGFDLAKIARRGGDDNYFADPEYGSDWSPAGTKSVFLKSKRHDSAKRSAQVMRSDFSSYSNERKKSYPAVNVASLNGMMKLKPSEDWKYSAGELSGGGSNAPNCLDPTRGMPQSSEANQSYIPKRQYPTGWMSQSSDADRPRRRAKVYGEAFCLDHPGAFGDSRIRSQKWNAEEEFQTHKSCIGFGSKVSSSKAPSAVRSGSSFRSDHRTKNLHDQLGRKSSRHEGANMEYSRNSPVYAQSEETQSDSSGQVEEGGNVSPYANKSVHRSSAVEAHQSRAKLEHEYKVSSKLGKSAKKAFLPSGGGIYGQTPKLEPYTRIVKKKGKADDINYIDDDDDDNALIRQGLVKNFSEKLQGAAHGSQTGDRKRKGKSGGHYSLEQENGTRSNVRGNTEEAEEILDLHARLAVVERQTNRLDSKMRISADYTMENSLPKKNKVMDEDEDLDELDEPILRHSSPKRQIEDSSARKKKGKRKVDVVVNSSAVIPESTILEKGDSELEMDRNTHKKQFTIITPTIHSGFSFSIIHLLSAVRKAFITAQMEDTEDIGNHLGKDGVSVLAKTADQKKVLNNSSGIFTSQSSDHLEESIFEHSGNLPSLSVQEIVHKVKSNPGDPCILETQEPLQDLVRGVLKIFSSKTAPLGAKGWKALVLYEKAIKSWSWVGPVFSSSSENDNSEEEISAEAWGIPHKMLVKLVDAFANWLKSGQETLQQIGTLPAPPVGLPIIDYKDRFRDLRAQKSLSTINPSSEEMRAYFHKEEMLRYSIPDRAFHYIATDGKKTIVAPLRRGGGKPTSKARDHYMLKTDRPPHVTVLCLVRDAAARLPGSIGTRADVCTLIRDSQYIVEDVTDAQVNQVVSGALDRLHYERDPCVQYDGERKLWVYLHQDREEEDFEDDGTSSTKKWKRQRKEAIDPSEVEAANESNYPATEEQAAVGSSACDFNLDLNIVTSDANMDDKGELVYNDLRPNRENVQSYVNAPRYERGRSNPPINWGVIGGNPVQETSMLCQENSTNQDFDDESFSRERVPLLSATLF
ncbi:hypothetical protein KSP39_PZI021713 [Platanthera zijinensis]|uniref:DEUBAD domain-containing protein n=1 Tax=Platanthera zijinensis TaxID=2320716 RepID=A0AAP0AX92_9ASPA